MHSQTSDALVAPVEGCLPDCPGGISVATVDAEAGLKILMVEDDEADAFLIKRALRNNLRVGEILHARDGAEALELIDNHQFRPDLALIDLQMPRKDGFGLLRDLSNRAAVAFPSIVLSTSRSREDRWRAGKRGAVQFVSKPNTMKKMTMALDEVIALI